MGGQADEVVLTMQGYSVRYRSGETEAVLGHPCGFHEIVPACGIDAVDWAAAIGPHFDAAVAMKVLRDAFHRRKLWAYTL